MDSVDYTKSLNREQRNFREKLDQNRESAKKDQARLEEHSANKSSKQTEVHKNQLNENEKVFQDRVETIHKDAKQVIENKAKKFHEEVKGDREQFSAEKEESVSGFNKRINGLAESYRKNAEEQDKVQAKERNLDKTRFSEKTQNLARKHEQEVQGILGKTETEGRNLQTDVRRDQYDIASKQRMEKEIINHENQTKRARESNDMRRSLEQIKNSSDDINFQSAEQARETFNRISRDKEQSIQDLQNSYAVANVKAKQGQATEKEKIIKNNKDFNTAQEREYSKARTKAEQDYQRKNGEDFMGEYNKEQNELRHKNQLEQKRQMYQGTMNDVTKKFNEELGKIKEENDVGRRDDAISNAKMAELKEKQFSVNGTEQLAKASKSRANLMGSYLERDKLKDQDYSRTLEAEKDVGKVKYNNLKNSFASSIQNLSEKNIKETEDIRNREGQERTKIIQDNRAQTNEIVGQLKKENYSKLNKTSSDYERRLEDVQNKMSEMQRFYEDKIAIVRQDSTIAMDRQNHIHKEQRKQDSEFMKSQMIVREEELHKNIDEWRTRYNRDLNNVSFDYERKMKTMMGDYEAKINILRTDQEKEKGRLQNEMVREIDRMKIAFESDKSRTVQQYENAIAKLKETVTAKGLAVDDFKKEMERNNNKA
ncbi:MAG: hypothetical protein ACOYL6_12850 [Bacteriovoracaceae bacterium]